MPDSNTTVSAVTSSPLIPRISLKDIAKVAKVSRMTVSLALRNHPALAARTRTRIRKVAERLGYQPDPEINRVLNQIRSKSGTHRSITIAYLVAHRKPREHVEHPYQARYYEGALRQAKALGYHLETFWLGEQGMTGGRLSNIIHARGIDGVIIAPLPREVQDIPDFRWNYFTAVAIGYSLIRPSLHRACNHQFQSMQLLVGELHRRGYRRIGLAMEHMQNHRVHYNWLGGFMSAPALFQSWPAMPVLLHEEWTCERIGCWLEEEKPEVIITSGKETEGWLGKLGLRTPHDIGLAHVDLIPEMMERRITGIDQNSAQVGAAAVDLLISQMKFHQKGIPDVPHIHMVQGTFLQGESTWRSRSSARLRKPSSCV